MTKPGAHADSSTAPTVPEDRYDLRILHAIRQIIQRIDVDSRKLAARHQITGPQLIALIAVVEKGPISAAGIAKQIYVSPSTLVGILDRLEAKGLIQRRRGERDRRVVHVSTTDAGRALVAEAPYPLQHSLCRALERLSVRQQKQTATSLDRLVLLLGAEDIEAEPVLQIGPFDALPNLIPPGQATGK